MTEYRHVYLLIQNATLITCITMAKTERKGLVLNFDELIDDEPPPELVVATKAPPIHHRQTISMDGGGGVEDEQNDELLNCTYAELTTKIDRLKKLVGSMCPRLADGGAKLKASLKKHEDELQKRKSFGSDKETGGCASWGRPRAGSYGAPNGLGHRSPQSAPPSSSDFGVLFANKLEENAHSKTANGFENEIHALNPCGLKRTKTRRSSPRKRRKTMLSSRDAPFKFPVNIGERDFYANGKRRDISAPSRCYYEDSFSSCFQEKWKTSQGQSTCALRHVNDDTVVLVDEEEPDVVEPRQQVYRVVESTKATEIYYPSRDDPESVVICSSDMESLAPEAYLSSPIMNFYIRYLQQTKPTDGERCGYHFFNTYFYKKLKEAVSSKNGKEDSFSKLRRWWKGVNIFEKAYIFLPIHENLHWSLVIICIPDKEDRLGPILLHLDSLGLHCSRSLFATVKKFLVEEWNFLRQGEVADIPIAEKIWENLPRRIDDNIVSVPQQKNDHDCGLFVLYFMERVIIEFDERLKKDDLEMFGRKWFKPEEASRMRCKIRDILEERFKNSSVE